MRKSLGSSFVFIVIFFHVGLMASSYKWSSSSSKDEVYVNEAIYLKYVCEFSDRGELFTIVLKPFYNKNNYSLKLIKKRDAFIDGKRVSTYEYLAKAKVEGKFTLRLNANMRETTLDSIVYSSGSRDDDRGDEEFKEKMLPLPSPKINIIPSNSTLVGEFNIEIKKDKKEVKAYEPYHLDIYISGIGNLDTLEAIKFQIEGVKIFTQKPFIDVQYTKDGEEGIWHQQFAFVGEKDFTIPALEIKYFDLKSRNLKYLKIESTSLRVSKVYKKEELLDDVEKNKPISFEFIYYILTFLTGFLVAKINFKKTKIDSKDMIFIQKVKSVKSLDALSILLILEDERKFSSILLELNSNKSLSLAQERKKVYRSL